MKKQLTALLFGGLLAWQCAASAQETTEAVESTQEVDRILAEVALPVGDEAFPMEAAPVLEEVVPAPASEEAVPATVEGEAVPAINLQGVEPVEGLDVTESAQRRPGDITINYTDVKLADMVRVLAQSVNANIIIPDGLDMTVSGNLNDVNWRVALEAILGDKGFVLLERPGNIYTIIPRTSVAAEPLDTETIELRFIKSEDAIGAVSSMAVSSNAFIRAVPNANVLIVKENARQIQEIKRVLEIVDQPRKQVFIEAKFVELNDSAIKDLGINWQVLKGYTVRATGLTQEFTRTDFRSTQDAQAFTSSRSRADASMRAKVDDRLVPGLEADEVMSNSSSSSGDFDGVVKGRNFTSFDAEEGTLTTTPSMEQEVIRSAVLSADDFALTLSALQQLDGVRIVSNPKMLVANGQTANIHVGRNEPNVRAVPQGDNATTFAYVLDGFIEIGVKLQVTPVISTAKNITVGIVPELSRLLGEKVVGEAGTSFPITQIRRINTEFAVESGKTVAIGGLTQGEEKEIVKKIPVLGDLPILGKYLFRHTSTQNIQDEIIIFVTVDMAHTEHLTNTDGLPEHGKLIHTWMEHNPPKP